MCVRPILVRNKSWLKHSIYRPYYSVPCGVCGECLKQKRLGLLPRLEKEFHVASWSTLMLFTYDEDHIHDLTLYPTRWDKKLYGINEDVIRIPTFSQKDFKNFFDVFRRKLYERYPEFKKTGIKFFCASEYGADPTKTMRGHFHLVTHFPLSVDRRTKIDIIKLQSSCWSRGATSLTLPNFEGYDKILIQDPTASARYVSKYVSKQIDQVDARFKLLRDQMDRSYFSKSWLKYDYFQKLFRSVKPKVWYSRGYGLACLPDVSKLDFESRYKVLERGILKCDKSGYHKLSRYFKDKFLYDFDYVYYGTCSDREKYHSRKLTPFGVFYKCKKSFSNLWLNYYSMRQLFSTENKLTLLKLSFVKSNGWKFLVDNSCLDMLLNIDRSSTVKRLLSCLDRFDRVLYGLSSYAGNHFVFKDCSLSRLYRDGRLILVDLFQDKKLRELYLQYDDMQKKFSAGTAKKFNDSSDRFRRLMERRFVNV